MIVVTCPHKVSCKNFLMPRKDTSTQLKIIVHSRKDIYLPILDEESDEGIDIKSQETSQEKGEYQKKNEKSKLVLQL